MGSLRIALVALSAVLAAALPAPAAANLPDLVADPVERPLIETYDDGSGERLLLRFDGFVHNAGAGALEVRGTDRSGLEMQTVSQRVYDGSPYSDTALADARLIFETSDGHAHWHLRDAARYSLVDAAGAEVAPAQKVGFCFIDGQRRESAGPAVPGYTDNCAQGQTTASSVQMGVSAGWRDIYPRNLAFQWVDISEVQPGAYFLRSQMDPAALVIESDESNPPSDRAHTVPGFVAQGVTASGLPAGTSAVSLAATAYGGVSNARYRIESAPARGTLDRPVGEWFTGSQVQYTPEPGYRGADSFTFSVRSAGMNFPRHPATATVALEVQAAGETVAISGAPAQLPTGATAQLEALVANGPPGVAWSVDGRPGGDAGVGTISPEGLYRAPGIVPAAGAVTVRATSAGGAYGEARIAIVPSNLQRPAPAPEGGGGGSGALPRPSIERKRGRLLVRFVPRRRGTLRVRALARGRRLDSCSARVVARRAFTCRLRVSRAVPSSAIRVRAALYRGGRKLDSVRVRLGG